MLFSILTNLVHPIVCRLWYFKRDDKFWNHRPSSIQHIGFRDYLLGKSSSIQAALYELNTDIKTKPINGKYRGGRGGGGKDVGGRDDRGCLICMS